MTTVNSQTFDPCWACRPATPGQAEARWTHICPPLYQQTDPSRLPQDALAQVNAWQFGPRGLIAVGPTGLGKTRALWLLIRRLCHDGRSVLAFSGTRFGEEVADAFGSGRGTAWMKGATGVDVLFLDDFTKSVLTERADSALFGVVETRTANCLPILTTTNLDGQGLARQISADRAAPLVRRLREFCEAVQFTTDTPGQG